VTYGGGIHIDARVVGFTAKGDDAFTIVLGREAGEPITVHLRYSQPAESPMTKAHYLRGVNLLLDHYRSGEVLEVGFTGSVASELQAVGLLMVEHGALHFMLEETPHEGE
jgi:hypothetical protein